MTLPTPSVSLGRIYRSTGWVARRYGKSTRTIDRWLRDPQVRFPSPDLIINGRRHWLDETLDKFDRQHPQAPARAVQTEGSQSHGH